MGGWLWLVGPGGSGVRGRGGRGGWSAPGWRSLLSQPPVSLQTSVPNPGVARLSLPVWDERQRQGLAVLALHRGPGKRAGWGRCMAIRGDTIPEAPTEC